jgi:hypothetical protein
MCRCRRWDGFEATAKIRELEKAIGKHIRIIAMKAHALQVRSVAWKQEWMAMSKAIRTNELYSAVEKAVKKEEESDQSPRKSCRLLCR